MKTKSTLFLGSMLALMLSLPIAAQVNLSAIPFDKSDKKVSLKSSTAHKIDVEKRFPMLRAKMPTVNDNNRFVGANANIPNILTVNPGQTIWGNVITDNFLGMYSFYPAQTIDFTELTPYKKGIFNGGCGLIDDELHGIYLDDMFAVYGVLSIFHYAFNTDTWELTVQPVQTNDRSIIAIETATDPKTGEVFGEFYSADLKSLEWGVVNYKTMTRTTISKAEHSYLAIGITNDGRAFGVADDGNLYQIDRITGTETLKGNTGVNVKDEKGNHFYQSGEIDPNTNEFYWAAKTADGECTLYTVDLNDGHVNLVGSMGQATVVGMTIPMPKAAATAPNITTNLQAEFAGPATSGTISFKAPDKQFDGTPLTGTLSYQVTSNSKQVASGNVAPGAIVQTTIQVDEGMNHFIVTTSNASGRSPKAKFSKYVGYDVPSAVGYIGLNIDSTGKATVTWEEPKLGLHQAYIGQLTYDIYRFGSTDTIRVASGITSSTFSETLPKTTRTSYAYGVRAINTTQRGPIARSEYEVTGDVFGVPFFDDFGNKNDALTYTIIDANNDGFTWKWTDTQEKGKAFRYSYSRRNNGDDWLISPPIKLEGGKTYNVGFVASNAEAQYKEKLEVKMGNAPTAEAMTTDVMSVTEITTPEYKEFEKQITPTADGDYYIGFHAVSEAKKYFIYLGSISIEPVSSNEAPATVANLKATANPTGALKAAVSFKAPEKTISGKHINRIEKIELRNGARIIKTIASPAPGAEFSFIDDRPTHGMNTYTAIAYNENGNGAKAMTRIYVGEDIPAEPVVRVIDQGTSVKLTWEPVKGVHGGVVDASKVSYEIFDVSEDGSLGDQIATVNNGATEYTVEGINTSSGLQYYRFWAISANYREQSSELVTASTIIGASYDLPFHNSFKNSTFEGQLFRIDSPNDKVIWRLTNQPAVDNDGGSLVFKPRAEGTSTLTTGKINMKGAAAPKLFFSYKAGQTPVRLEMFFKLKDGTITAPVWSNNFANQSGTGKWVNEAIDLPLSLAAEDYAILKIKAFADGSSEETVYLDNISITDPLQRDAAMELSAPESVKKGQTVKLKLKVSNQGLDKIENAAVTVRLNDKIIHQSTIEQSLKMLDETEIPVTYATTILDPSSKHVIKAELTVPGDLNNDNNTASANISLEKANVLPATDLKSNGDNRNSVELSWKEPESIPETITDNFESYEAWQTDFGKWTTVDVDSGYAIQLSMHTKYPHQGEQFAFMNWKPDDVFRNSNELTPHSGEKAAVAIYQQDKNEKPIASDNWLISQLLSGKEQIVRFWVNNVRGNQKTAEIFDVLLSQTDNKPASFRKIGDTYTQDDGEWTEITVKLPAGTRYFAIHHISPADQAFVFMIDDVTFEASNGPAAYNIYRDDALLANTIQTYFTDDHLQPGTTHNYKVTAVYPDGSESEPISASVTTSIRDVIQNADNHHDVYTTGGIKMHKELRNLKSLPKGIYIVNGKTIVVN